ncbi:MAG TPA: hypothetical protein VF306_05245 [Pirellulales bacterium]
MGDYKLIEWFEDGRVELYNVREDLSEWHDLAGSMPDRVDQMRELLHGWRKEVAAAMPTPNPDYRPGEAASNPATKN